MMDSGLAELRVGAKALHDELAAASSPVAARLADSVLHPLDELGEADVDPPARTPSLAALAELATSLRAQPAASDQLIEATAALQELALAEDPALLDRLEELQTGLPADIRVAAYGPYLVTNAKALADWLGQELLVRPQLARCRCGASATKPYCDGSHARVGFSGEKSPDRVPDRRDTYGGLQVTIYDNRGICQHSGLCSVRLAAAFRTDKEPFVAASAGRMDELIRAVRDCPSGALSYAIDGAEHASPSTTTGCVSRRSRSPRTDRTGSPVRSRSTTNTVSRLRERRAPRWSTTRCAAAATRRTSRSAAGCTGTSSSAIQCLTPTRRPPCSSGPEGCPRSRA
jgi:CDGSH-type Zn-finger protein